MKKLFAAVFAALFAFTVTHAFATSAIKAPAGTIVADDEDKDKKKDENSAQDDEEKKTDEQKKSD